MASTIMGDFIESPAEIMITNANHYDRKVYYRLYTHMLREAQSDFARTPIRSAG